MDFIRKRGKFFLLLVLPATVWLIINSAINSHYHKLQNGKIVQHCHPFKHNENNKSPFEDHNHTDFEYYILDQFSKPLALFSLFCIFFSITIACEQIKYLSILILPLKNYFFSDNYRSPPFF